MSKSGLFAHFGSKEELQLATIDAARAIYEELVIEPAGEAAAGVPRLRAYVERSSTTSRRASSPAAASSSPPCELATHPGPVRDGAMAFSQRWLELLAAEVAAGQAAASSVPPPTRRRSPSSSMRSWSWATCNSWPAAERAALDFVRRAVDARLDALRPVERTF